MANGLRYPEHSAYMNGLQVNVRALRLDGKQVGVVWTQAEYHRAATARLIAFFNSHPLVKKIFFNESRVPGLFPLKNHDNHFYVEVRT